MYLLLHTLSIYGIDWGFELTLVDSIISEFLWVFPMLVHVLFVALWHGPKVFNFILTFSSAIWLKTCRGKQLSAAMVIFHPELLNWPSHTSPYAKFPIVVVLVNNVCIYIKEVADSSSDEDLYQLLFCHPSFLLTCGVEMISAELQKHGGELLFFFL